MLATSLLFIDSERLFRRDIFGESFFPRKIFGENYKSVSPVAIEFLKSRKSKTNEKS